MDVLLWHVIIRQKIDAGKVVVQDVVIEDVVDDVPPPPPHLTSNFKTLQDWLFNICDTEKPEKSIAPTTLVFLDLWAIIQFPWWV